MNPLPGVPYYAYQNERVFIVYKTSAGYYYEITKTGRAYHFLDDLQIIEKGHYDAFVENVQLKQLILESEKKLVEKQQELLEEQRILCNAINLINSLKTTTPSFR